MKDNTRYLVTIQPVRQGEELTADYRLQPDLEQPERFLNELDISEETINECWKGYVKKGMKKKGNKMVPNCVPQNEEVKYGIWSHALYHHFYNMFD